MNSFKSADPAKIVWLPFFDKLRVDILDSDYFNDRQKIRYAIEHIKKTVVQCFMFKKTYFKKEDNINVFFTSFLERVDDYFKKNGVSWSTDVNEKLFNHVKECITCLSADEKYKSEEKFSVLTDIIISTCKYITIGGKLKDKLKNEDVKLLKSEDVKLPKSEEDKISNLMKSYIVLKKQVFLRPSFEENMSILEYCKKLSMDITYRSISFEDIDRIYNRILMCRHFDDFFQCKNISVADDMELASAFFKSDWEKDFKTAIKSVFKDCLIGRHKEFFKRVDSEILQKLYECSSEEKQIPLTMFVYTAIVRDFLRILNNPEYVIDMDSVSNFNKQALAKRLRGKIEKEIERNGLKIGDDLYRLLDQYKHKVSKQILLNKLVYAQILIDKGENHEKARMLISGEYRIENKNLNKIFEGKVVRGKPTEKQKTGDEEKKNKDKEKKDEEIKKDVEYKLGFDDKLKNFNQ